ncbi:I78 family peptidase inhibitor [Lysobacter sp. 2RAF19]
MHRFGLALVVACMLCACATTDAKEKTAPSGKGVAKCDTSTLDWAKGQPANEANARRLVRESGLGLWRIIGPDNVERADYRPDRLTIYTDKDNIIQSLDCH